MTWKLDPKLRGLLVCPKCRGELIDTPGGLVCQSDNLLFPVVDSVPMMVLELAKPFVSAQSVQTGD